MRVEFREPKTTKWGASERDLRAGVKQGLVLDFQSFGGWWSFKFSRSSNKVVWARVGGGWVAPVVLKSPRQESAVSLPTSQGVWVSFGHSKNCVRLVIGEVEFAIALRLKGGLYLMPYQKCIQNPSLNAAPNVPASPAVIVSALSGLGSESSPVGTYGAADLVTPLSPVDHTAKRGRPMKPRYVCRWCGCYTKQTSTYCCQECGKPRIPAGLHPSEIRSAYRTWVGSYYWTHFGTGTFPWPLDGSTEHNRLAVQNYERRFFHRVRSICPATAWFAVGEPDASHQLHIHWVSYIQTLTSSFIESLWRRKYEGFCEVGSYYSGASVYTCKTLDRSDLHSVGGQWISLQ